MLAIIAEIVFWFVTGALWLAMIGWAVAGLPVDEDIRDDHHADAAGSDAFDASIARWGYVGEQRGGQ